MADTEAQQNAGIYEDLLFGGTGVGGLNDFLITSPEMMREWALTVIKSKFGIRNPPPWLICAYTGESYKLGRY